MRNFYYGVAILSALVGLYIQCVEHKVVILELVDRVWTVIRAPENDRPTDVPSDDPGQRYEALWIQMSEVVSDSQN